MLFVRRAYHKQSFAVNFTKRVLKYVFRKPISRTWFASVGKHKFKATTSVKKASIQILVWTKIFVKVKFRNWTYKEFWRWVQPNRECRTDFPELLFLPLQQSPIDKNNQGTKGGIDLFKNGRQMSKMSLCIDKDIILFISGDLCCGTNSEGYIKGGEGGSGNNPWDVYIWYKLTYVQFVTGNKK